MLLTLAPLLAGDGALLPLTLTPNHTTMPSLTASPATTDAEKYTELLERHGRLRLEALEMTKTLIRRDARIAELEDRLGAYAGEQWERCPHCGPQMAVTDGAPQLECVS